MTKSKNCYFLWKAAGLNPCITNFSLPIFSKWKHSLDEFECLWISSQNYENVGYSLQSEPLFFRKSLGYALILQHVSINRSYIMVTEA